MSNDRRNGFAWSVNECLRLQREYELLELSVEEIAKLHERGVYAILFRLQQEGLIDNFIEARGFKEFSQKKTPIRVTRSSSRLIMDYSMN